MNTAAQVTTQSPELKSSSFVRNMRAAVAVAVASVGGAEIASGAAIFDGIQRGTTFNNPNFTIMNSSGEGTGSSADGSDFAYWSIAISNTQASPIPLGIVEEAIDATFSNSAVDLKIEDVSPGGQYANNPLVNGQQKFFLVPADSFNPLNPADNAVWSVSLSNVAAPVVDIGNRTNAGDVLLYSFDLNGAAVPTGNWRLVSSLFGAGIVVVTEEAHAEVTGKAGLSLITGNVPVAYNDEFGVFSGPSVQSPAVAVYVAPEPATLLGVTLAALAGTRRRRA